MRKYSGRRPSKKRIIWSAAVLALIGAGIWVSSRWSAWFHNPPEEPFTAAPAPDFLMLTFADSEPFSRNVSWMCDSVLRPSRLEVMSLPDTVVKSVEARGEVYRSRAGVGAYYHAKLRHLKPGATYRYRAVTGDSVSEWHTFEVADARPGRPVSFIYVGDVQDSLGGQSGRIIADAFKRHPDASMLLCAGDLVERPRHYDWGVMFSLLDSLAASVPILTATGNHDYLKGLPPYVDRRFRLVFPYFLDSGCDDNLVYTQTYGDVRFFVLDSHRDFPFLWQQREWLKKQLEKSTEKWKVLVLHHPLNSMRHNHVFVNAFFGPLVEEYGVDAVLQAHEHAYRRCFRGEKGETLDVISHCAPKNYIVDFSEADARYGVGDRYWQYISIDGDTLRYSAYKASDGALYDSVVMVKGRRPIDLATGKIPEELNFTAGKSSKETDFVRRIEERKKLAGRKAGR